MNWLRPTLILVTALLTVYLQATFDLPRRIVGVQLNLLPALMVYASLAASLATMTSLAILGGLMFDSLSYNPPGISMIPLFLAGMMIFSIRTIVLREQYYARFVLGTTA